MPTSVPMMADAGALTGADWLYLIQGMNLDRDRKVPLEKVREYCTGAGVALYELNTSNADGGVLELALGASTTNAFVVVSGTVHSTFTLSITGSVPAGCQVNVLMEASGSLKIVSGDGATVNGIDPTLLLSVGDTALLGRGTGTVWWGSATRSAANTDAAVLAEYTRAEAEEQALSQAIAAEASTRGDADTALGTRITGITSKAIELDLKDADASTGVLSLNVSSYGSDLLVRLVNSTSANPPTSSGYFTLQIAGSLPAGASLRVANSMGSVEGETLNVKISFTEPYTYGIGIRTLSGMALLPLLSRAFFKAVVAPDGQTWLGDSVDNLAMAAYNRPFQLAGSVNVRADDTPLGYYEIGNGTETNLSGGRGAPIVLPSAGSWEINLFLTFRTTWIGGGSGESDHETLAQIYLLDGDGLQARPMINGLRVYANSTVSQAYFTRQGSIMSIFTERQAQGLGVYGKFPVAHDSNTRLDFLDMRATWRKLAA